MQSPLVQRPPAHGSYLAFDARPNGGSAEERLRVTSLGSCVVGDVGSALATNATDGYPHIPTCAGPPSGVPTSFAGRVALVYDTTNGFLYFYRSGWKKSTV
jgi:hypothetical protein